MTRVLNLVAFWIVSYRAACSGRLAGSFHVTLSAWAAAIACSSRRATTATRLPFVTSLTKPGRWFTDDSSALARVALASVPVMVLAIAVGLPARGAGRAGRT